MNNGSVQGLNIPLWMKNVYKTVWELKQKILVDMTRDRSPYIDQTSSMNLFFEKPTIATLSSLYMYGWRAGLKTLSYYIRSRPAVDAVKFSILEQKGTEGFKQSAELPKEQVVCTEEICTVCSS